MRAALLVRDERELVTGRSVSQVKLHERRLRRTNCCMDPCDHDNDIQESVRALKRGHKLAERTGMIQEGGQTERVGGRVVGQW